MSYAKVENNTIVKYPYGFGDLKKDYPKVSFPNTYLSQAAANNEYNIVEVIDVPMPEEEGSHAVEEEPLLNGSVWSQNWKLVSDPVVESEVIPEWETNRRKDYGMSFEQIEFITENGLEAWQAKVADIKAKYPKS